ncbi:MAG: hypothetical protein M3R53_10095 [Candidatus Eremiobacteraeota bacterium]|nr:hypothetical protein [Candidatus Eremiobacteraeota bacterium]
MLWPTFVQFVFAAVTSRSPCDLVTKTDVERTLHWGVRAGHPSTYHLPRASGALCTYEANEGTVLVTIPDEGSSFFQNNDLVDPFNNGLGAQVGGFGASVRVFDSTVYVSHGRRSVAVAVQSNGGAAEESSLLEFAKLVAHKLCQRT